MNYSTFNAKTFYIKKDSTLPELKYQLTQKMLEKYDISEDMLEDVAVTFSMIDAETGLYRIANVGANLIVSVDRSKFPDEEKYTLVHKFTLSQTAKSGRYLGEFVIDFLDSNVGCGKLKLPTTNNIYIIICDSITKTTVI